MDIWIYLKRYRVKQFFHVLLEVVVSEAYFILCTRRVSVTAQARMQKEKQEHNWSIQAHTKNVS